MDPAIAHWVGCKRVAVVGASRSGKGFGSMAMQELSKRGYQVFAVNDEAEEPIDGVTTVRHLGELEGQVDAALLTIPPERAPDVLHEAAEHGIDHVWIQQGGDTPDLEALGRTLGLDMVSGKCVLMYAPPVSGLHGFHRGLKRIFGGL